MVTAEPRADGSFSPAARAAIYEIGLGRCIGCGRTDLSAQHRRARGMGGTTDVVIGHPANGVPLCGGGLAGVLGCHGWAERHRHDARLLGWALHTEEPALGTPFWSRIWGWRIWVVDETDFPQVAYFHEPDFDDPDRFPEGRRLADRLDALARFRRARPEPGPPPPKTQR